MRVLGVFWQSCFNRFLRPCIAWHGLVCKQHRAPGVGTQLHFGAPRYAPSLWLSCRQYSLSSLICLGGFKNQRQMYNWEGCTLELDQTQYEWGTLYELECETVRLIERACLMASMAEGTKRLRCHACVRCVLLRAGALYNCQWQSHPAMGVQEGCAKRHGCLDAHCKCRRTLRSCATSWRHCCPPTASLTSTQLPPSLPTSSIGPSSDHITTSCRSLVFWRVGG